MQPPEAFSFELALELALAQARRALLAAHRQAAGDAETDALQRQPPPAAARGSSEEGWEVAVAEASGLRGDVGAEQPCSPSEEPAPPALPLSAPVGALLRQPPPHPTQGRPPTEAQEEPPPPPPPQPPEEVMQLMAAWAQENAGENPAQEAVEEESRDGGGAANAQWGAKSGQGQSSQRGGRKRTGKPGLLGGLVAAERMSKRTLLLSQSEHKWSACPSPLAWVSTWKAKQQGIEDVVMSVLIILNAVTIGVSLDFHPEWIGWLVFDGVFASIFVLEMLLHMCRSGFRIYFLGDAWRWNVAESILVICGLLDFFFSLAALFVKSETALVFTVVRVLRLARIARILRVARLHIFQELLLMVDGCIAGAKTLFWSQLLLALPLYMGALLCRQALGGHLAPEDDDDGTRAFQTLGKAYFNMYRCFLGGECYSQGGTPIFPNVMAAYGDGWGLFYYLMSACMSFGMANVIIAIFVESTVASAKSNELRQKQRRLTDRNMFAAHVTKLMELMWAQHEDNLTGCSITDLSEEQLSALQITAALFEQLLAQPEFQEILEKLDIAHEEQAALFETLDVDGSGTLDLDELVSGMDKMRGDARRSDVVSVGLLLRAVSEELRSSQKELREQLRELSRRVGVGPDPGQRLPVLSLTAPTCPAGLGEVPAAQM